MVTVTITTTGLSRYHGLNGGIHKAGHVQKSGCGNGSSRWLMYVASSRRMFGQLFPNMPRRKAHTCITKPHLQEWHPLIRIPLPPFVIGSSEYHLPLANSHAPHMLTLICSYLPNLAWNRNGGATGLNGVTHHAYSSITGWDGNSQYQDNGFDLFTTTPFTPPIPFWARLSFILIFWIRLTLK